MLMWEGYRRQVCAPPQSTRRRDLQDDALRPARASHRDDALRRQAHPRRGDARHQSHGSAQPVSPAFIELRRVHAHTLRAHALPDASRRAPRIRPVPALRRAVCVTPKPAPVLRELQLTRALPRTDRCQHLPPPERVWVPDAADKQREGAQVRSVPLARPGLLACWSHPATVAAAAQDTSSSRRARRARVVRSFSCAVTHLAPPRQLATCRRTHLALSPSLSTRQDGLDWVPSSSANAKHKQLQVPHLLRLWTLRILCTLRHAPSAPYPMHALSRCPVPQTHAPNPPARSGRAHAAGSALLHVPSRPPDLTVTSLHGSPSRHPRHTGTTRTARTTLLVPPMHRRQRLHRPPCMHLPRHPACTACTAHTLPPSRPALSSSPSTRSTAGAAPSPTRRLRRPRPTCTTRARSPTRYSVAVLRTQY
jgi:hypothetical protein